MRSTETMRHSDLSSSRSRDRNPDHGIGTGAPTRKALAKKPRWFKRLSHALRLDAATASAAAPAAAAEPLPPGAAPLATAASPLDQLWEFAPRLRRAWSVKTSVLPDIWSAERPALGQSAATACTLQDLLGGDIIESRLVLADGREYSHFANVVDGLVIDLAQTETERVASIAAVAGGHEGFPSMRAYVLAQPGVDKSYAALTARIAELAARR
jgi:hypothetical protein